MVRTRIAPSPTGFPHIGTIYQALFDFAYAKGRNGKFIVRIEDTDRTRFVEGAEAVIFSSFDWFGLSEDESPRVGGAHGPYRQSERLDIYKKYAGELVEKKHAYYCFCTKEELEAHRALCISEKKVPMYSKKCRDLSEDAVRENLSLGKPYTIRMKIPESGAVTVRDEIRGEIVFHADSVDDQVILKSDGFPTYHLAVVVDDHLMGITHVVRGEEWLSSTPKHVLLYDYLAWEKPLFYHTPVLRNPDKSKLSKRHGHTSVSWYRESGFLPEAILNYLALMGWSHPEEKEIFDIDEFTKQFDLSALKPVGPIFDITKLEWMNGMYIRALKDDVLCERIHAFIGDTYKKELILRTVPLVKERMKTLADYLPLAEFFFKRPSEYAIDLVQKKDILRKVADTITHCTQWDADAIGAALQELAQQEQIKFGDFFMTIRVAITGKKISPPLNESLEILGKEECVARLSIHA